MTAPRLVAQPPFAQHRTFSGPLYIVTRDFGMLGYESVTSPGDTRKTIAADIASGEIDRVVSVIEIIDGLAFDITDAIREAVENIEPLDPMRGVDFPFAANH